MNSKRTNFFGQQQISNETIEDSQPPQERDKRMSVDQGVQQVGRQLPLDEREIGIHTMSNIPVNVSITKNSNALDVCKLIADKIGMLSYFDFRLQLLDEKKNTRFLDNDEPLFKLIFKKDFKSQELDTKPKENNRTNKMNQSLLKIKHVFLNTLGLKHEMKRKLRFVKYLWLEQDLEEFDYKSDPIRLNLIASQILQDISETKISLNQNDAFVYASLFVFITQPDLIKLIQSDPIPSKSTRTSLFISIKAFLPPSMIKQIKEQIWIDNILLLIFSISKTISDTITQAQKQSSLITTPSSQSIACTILLNSFKKNPQYGATFFHCQTYKKTIKDAKKNGLTIPENVTFCIKCDSIQILDVTKQTKIMLFTYIDVKEIKVFPSSITFILFSDPMPYRFDTTKSFEISQLMTAYNNMMTDIKKITLTHENDNINSKDN